MAACACCVALPSTFGPFLDTLHESMRHGCDIGKELALDQIGGWTALVPLLSAILGGLIGSLSGLGAQMLSHRLALGKERNQRTRDRFSELVDLVLAHDDWLEQRRLSRLFAEGDVATQPPIAKAQMLVAVHYPGLTAAFDDFNLKSSIYMGWQSKGAEKRASRTPGINDGFNEAYTPYLKSFTAFKIRLAEYARSSLPQ